MACFELTLCLAGDPNSVLGKGNSSPASSCLHPCPVGSCKVHELHAQCLGHCVSWRWCEQQGLNRLVGWSVSGGRRVLQFNTIKSVGSQRSPIWLGIVWINKQWEGINLFWSFFFLGSLDCINCAQPGVCVQPGVCAQLTCVTNFGYCCDNAGCAHDVVIAWVYGKNSSRQNTELALKALIPVCSLVSPWERKGSVLIVECCLC